MTDEDFEMTDEEFTSFLAQVDAMSLDPQVRSLAIDILKFTRIVETMSTVESIVSSAVQMCMMEGGGVTRDGVLREILQWHEDLRADLARCKDVPVPVVLGTH